MKRTVLAAVLPLSLCLSACGEHLGEYQMEDVQLVRAIPPAAIDGGTHSLYPEYLRVEVASRTSLYAANTGPGLYTDVDFCPLRNPHRLIAFEPMASDGGAVESWRRKTALTPEHQDKRYHYFVYVVPSSPPRKPFTNSEDVIPGYDLRSEKRDVCLRFFVPGYNIIPSRSDTVRIPAETLASAFKRS